MPHRRQDRRLIERLLRLVGKADTMNSTSPSLPGAPIIPRPLSLPLALLPSATYSQIMVRLLNRLFAPELSDGELDFLEGRVMRVNVTDARIRFALSLQNEKLVVAADNQPEDLSIEGTVYDFLLLATRREDADTLFFNRRLRLGGDTELGLYVKNFLDALELEERIGPFLRLLNGATTLAGHIPELPKPRFPLPIPGFLKKS